MWEKVRGVFPVTSNGKNAMNFFPNSLVSTFYWKTYFVLNMQYVIHLLLFIKLYRIIISINNNNINSIRDLSNKLGE